MTPQERAEAIRALDAAHAERAALDVPPPTGRGDIADAVAAEEHFVRVDSAWDALNRDLFEARAASGLFPSRPDAAEVLDLERRTSAAWASRERAKAHRDRLMFELDRANSPGMGLPPGGGGEYGSEPW